MIRRKPTPDAPRPEGPPPVPAPFPWKIIPESVSADGLRARADLVRPKLDDGGSCARHLELAADLIDKLQKDNQRLYAAWSDKQRDKVICHGDGGECERLYSRIVPGHVVTAEDQTDYRNFLADNNDEMENAASILLQGYEQALLEIGGEELLAVVRLNNQHEMSEAVAKALARFNQKMAQRKKEGS